MKIKNRIKVSVNNKNIKRDGTMIEMYNNSSIHFSAIDKA